MSQLMHVHYGVSMSNGHKGLSKRAKPLAYTLFINKTWTAMKLLTPNRDGVLHYKSPKNRPIDPKSIKYLPQCVNGEELNYSAALELALTKEYAKLRMK